MTSDRGRCDIRLRGEISLENLDPLFGRGDAQTSSCKPRRIDARCQASVHCLHRYLTHTPLGP